MKPIPGAHIAFIGQKGIPAEFVGTSGVEFYVEKRAKGLVKEGKTVDCYVRSWATPKAMKFYEGIRLIHVPTVNTKHLDAPLHSLFSTLYSLFTSAGTVWYQASGPALFSFIPKLFGKRVLVTIHTLEWNREKWGPVAKQALKLGELIAAKTADTLYAVSEDLADYLRHSYGREVVMDEPGITPVPYAKPDIITKKYGLKGNDYILYMGRFVPEKRIGWLIRAYQEIKLKGIKLVLAGGSSHTDEYEKKLRRAKDVIFTGYVFGKEKQELLSNCFLFVLPSSTEGNPVVLTELPEDRVKLTYSGDSYKIFNDKLAGFLRNGKR